MIQLVIGLNVAIALSGFILAWRLWHLKRTFISASVALHTLEQEVQLALTPETSVTLLQGRDAIASARTRYRRLRQQLQQLEQVFVTAVVVLRLVRRVRL